MRCFTTMVFGTEPKWPFLSAEWDRPQMLRQRAERGDRQEQERSHDHDCAEEQTAKCEGIVAQCSQAEGRTLLHPEKSRHRDRRYDWEITAEHNDEAAGDVPRNRLGGWTWVVVQSVRDV